MIAIETFAVVSVRDRNSRSGSSGHGDRASTATNSPSSAADAPSDASDAVEVHPSLVARVNPYTSSIRPVVAVTAPRTSKWRWPSSGRLSARTIGARSAAATPTGTLTKKIHDQLR